MRPRHPPDLGISCVSVNCICVARPDFGAEGDVDLLGVSGPGQIASIYNAGAAGKHL